MDRQEEKALVQKLARMDDAAWEVLCREYSRPLLCFVQLKFACNQGQAEEIVQMAFVRCVRSIRSFKPSRGRLLEWLKAICRNEAHTLLRDDRTKGAAEHPSWQAGRADTAVLEKIDSVPVPSEILSRKEVQLLIHETVAELYFRYRKVLILKYLENRQVSEIAERLGQSEKAIESLLTRSRRAFKEVFLRKLKGRQLQVGELLE